MRVSRSSKDQKPYPKLRQSKKLGRRSNRTLRKMTSTPWRAQSRTWRLRFPLVSSPWVTLCSSTMEKTRSPKRSRRTSRSRKNSQDPSSEEEPDDEDIEESEGETRLVPFRAPSPGDFLSFPLVFCFFVHSFSFACHVRMSLLCCSIQHCYHCRTHVALLYHGNMATVLCM